MAYRDYGEPQNLELMDLPMPKVAPGMVLIRVELASVNPVDWKVMAGGLEQMLDVVFPVIPGWDVAGTVEAVGPDTPEFAPGQRVAAYARKDFVHGGTYAEYVAVPAGSVAAIPETVYADTAAGLPLAGLTALRTLETLQISAADRLLIHAASGAVGHIAAQLAAHADAQVLGTASGDKHARLERLGAAALTYGDGLVQQVQQHWPEGATAAADFAGGVLDQTLQVLAPAGRHASVADPTVVEHGGQFVWVRPDGQRLEALLRQVADGQLTVTIDTVYPLEEAASAMEHSQRGADGKILIDVAG